MDGSARLVRPGSLSFAQAFIFWLTRVSICRWDQFDGAKFVVLLDLIIREVYIEHGCLDHSIHEETHSLPSLMSPFLGSPRLGRPSGGVKGTGTRSME